MFVGKEKLLELLWRKKGVSNCTCTRYYLSSFFERTEHLGECSTLIWRSTYVQEFRLNVICLEIMTLSQF